MTSTTAAVRDDRWSACLINFSSFYSMISVFSAKVVGLFLEAIFYGIYLVTFGACLLPRTFHERDGPWRLRLPFWRLPWVIAVVTMALFLILTAHLSVGLIRLLSTQHNPKGISERNWVTTTTVCFQFCCCTACLSTLRVVRPCCLIRKYCWVMAHSSVHTPSYYNAMTDVYCRFTAAGSYTPSPG